MQIHYNQTRCCQIKMQTLILCTSTNWTALLNFESCDFVI